MEGERGGDQKRREEKERARVRARDSASQREVDGRVFESWPCAPARVQTLA